MLYWTWFDMIWRCIVRCDYWLDDWQVQQELFSEWKASVGVMFASIPNFTEFYSEDVNKGMECIRLLNEIIGNKSPAAIESISFLKFKTEIWQHWQWISTSYWTKAASIPSRRLRPSEVLTWPFPVSSPSQRSLQHPSIHSLHQPYHTTLLDKLSKIAY